MIFPPIGGIKKVETLIFFLGSFQKIPTCYLMGAVLDTWNPALWNTLGRLFM
jgi:hypothetical protein